MTGPDVGATVAFADYARDVEALRKQLADAQARMEALQRERDELEELTSVICGHCCEPMAIPSRAVLQAALDAERQQHTQLLALVRAAVTRWQAQINVKEGVSFRMAMKALEATMDATTPAHEQTKATVFNEWGGALRQMADVEPKGGDGE